jgi:hypothetical protein
VLELLSFIAAILSATLALRGVSSFIGSGQEAAAFFSASCFMKASRSFTVMGAIGLDMVTFVPHRSQMITDHRSLDPPSEAG